MSQWQPELIFLRQTRVNKILEPFSKTIVLQGLQLKAEARGQAMITFYHGVNSTLKNCLYPCINTTPFLNYWSSKYTYRLVECRIR